MVNDHFAFTGTKDGWTDPQTKSACAELQRLREKYTVMHNGDCVGADERSALVWDALKGEIVLHPPINPKYRAFLQFAQVVLPEDDYIKRDHHMVDSSSYLLGTPKTMYEYLRSGTWSTVRYARKRGLPLTLVYPDGSVVHEPGNVFNSIF